MIGREIALAVTVFVLLFLVLAFAVLTISTESDRLLERCEKLVLEDRSACVPDYPTEETR